MVFDFNLLGYFVRERMVFYVSTNYAWLTLIMEQAQWTNIVKITIATYIHQIIVDLVVIVYLIAGISRHCPADLYGHDARGHVWEGCSR